jgi:uncharacterized membrane protein HdeD (DUF308 family)
MGREPEGERAHAWFLAAGAALILLGAIAAGLPLVLAIAGGRVVGPVLLAAGALHAIHSFRYRRVAAWLPRLGVAAIHVLAGVVLLDPAAGAASPIPTVGALLVAAGALRIAAARALRPIRGWSWTLASGVASALLGGVCAVWPAYAAEALGALVGLDLLLAGWSLVMLAPVGRPALRGGPASP